MTTVLRFVLVVSLQLLLLRRSDHPDSILIPVVEGANNDLFNYGYTTYNDGRISYGQPNWNAITCEDPATCTGFAEKYPFTAYDFVDTYNNCRWCPQSSAATDACGLHRQSPVDLKRDRAILNGTNFKTCPDWHYMQTRDDTCTFDDMKDGFSVERHALRLEIPQLPDGQIGCVDELGQRLYPRLDYSKGFPNWWWMQRVEVMAPSSHRQEGTQYAAEVILQHFYELDHYKNQLGHISIFLQDYPGAESWAFLDKLICHWRIAEEKVRAQCGLPAATPYGRCQLFRNQEATPDWLAEQAGQVFDVEPPRNPYWNVTQPTGTTRVPTPPPTTLAPGTAQQPIPTVPAPIAPVPVNIVPVTIASPPPVPAPTVPPVAMTSKPVTASPTDPPVNSIPMIQCDAWEINFPRMCSSTEACCGTVRADTSYCWGVYEQLGQGIEAACFHCCDTPQSVGPVAPAREDLPQSITCSALENVPNRMCQADGGCCVSPRSGSDYCKDQYGRFSDNELEQICHYCCSSPMTVSPGDTNDNNRNLRLSSNHKKQKQEVAAATVVSQPLEGAHEFNVYGKKFLLSKENFAPIEEDEQEYFDRRYSEHKRRNLQQAHLENYDDVEWSAYEWLFRVETEYYFRYEGTMLVPPCWEVVHWRNMKDPLVVHKRQIDEIHRLLAHRLNPETCVQETAGIVTPDGNHIATSREVQYMHEQHRFVFCECPNWPSKFKGDREWCHRHKEDLNYTRFYDRPYSFNTNGQWLPPQTPVV